MSFENFNGSIYINYNRNDTGGIDVQQISNEWTVVQEIGCSMLSQIPYQKQRVLLKNEANVNLREVFDNDAIGVNDFKVSYTHGLIWFHPSQVGKSFKATFGGCGVQYISGSRVISGLDSNGRPIVQSDIIAVVKDYNNRIKPEFQGMKDQFQGMKDDYQLSVKDNYQNTVKDDYTKLKDNYQTNIVDNYKTTVKDDYNNLKQNYQTDIVNKYNTEVKQDYKTNIKDAYITDVKNPWFDELKPELERAIENYHVSNNPNWITQAHWTKIITADDTNTFKIDLSSFNPVGDQINKFAYQSAGQEGATELIEGEHWIRAGATITLLKDLVFMTGDKVFVNVYRGIAVTPIAGTNGGDLQNKSVIESKLSQDVQDKLNTVYYENTLNFVATVNNTTQFTIADSTFNPVTDKLKIYQDNMLIRKDDNYTLTGMVVTLAEALNIGDKIYYEIGKNAVSSISNYMADGGLIREESISKKKLTKDLQNELASTSEQLAEKSKLTNERVEVLNNSESTKGILELANFAGQGTVSNLIAFILHHYTDSGMIQFDNVGDGTVLTLKNAHNPVRRPDKPSNYVGSGKFLALAEHNYNKGYAEEIFYLSKNGVPTWTGVKGTAMFEQNKLDDGTYAYRMKINNAHNYLFDILNGANQVFYMQNNVSKTRLDFITPANQTNGMFFETKAGGIRFNPFNKVTEFIGDFKVGDGANWNYPQYITSGTTIQRPTVTRVGQQYFDTDLNKPIWRNKSNNGWVDAMGVGV